ncbi:MAG: UDP-N-acetylmuramoyl-L-alanine--D-glutamate ligase [Burkholderiales bacterium]
MELRDREVLVLGLGDTGLSCVRWLKNQGARVRVVDSRAEPPHRTTLTDGWPDVDLQTGPLRVEALREADFVVASPGVALSEPLLVEARRRGIAVLGDIELFARSLRSGGNQASRVVAITGSNGKSTVTTMVGAMCSAAGLSTMVAGNIGLPVLDALYQTQASLPDVFVLELSSFQLETTESLAVAAATVLNISADHMDRYSSLEQYAAAKARIFMGDGVQVLNRDDPHSMGMAQPGHRIVTFGLNRAAHDHEFGLLDSDEGYWLTQGSERLMPVTALTVSGLHNAANALAALALSSALGLPRAPMLQSLRDFKGLPHRTQKITEIQGVAFYDDSKGTNVGATLAALNGMTQKVVLIAGGDGKGQDFTPLRGAVTAHARAVVLIGRDAPQLAAALHATVPLVFAGDMEKAVSISFARAEPGDAVLLSPACASFDMFRNYAHRAEVFIGAVSELAAAVSGGERLH